MSAAAGPRRHPPQYRVQRDERCHRIRQTCEATATSFLCVVGIVQKCRPPPVLNHQRLELASVSELYLCSGEGMRPGWLRSGDDYAGGEDSSSIYCSDLRCALVRRTSTLDDHRTQGCAGSRGECDGSWKQPQKYQLGKPLLCSRIRKDRDPYPGRENGCGSLRCPSPEHRFIYCQHMKMKIISYDKPCRNAQSCMYVQKRRKMRQ